ncbi:MAG: GDSL-type esterase/lipase family protein [Deltaproteobacteria bacterium]|nr:GDSL-type esterase/lipase family protein [Candidatus Deferrimicrobium borealis]
MSAAVSGLTSGTTYYFRVAASNSAGIIKGSILSFTTTTPLLGPNSTTNPATSITINSATLNGGVNPNGTATTAWFEWGTSPTLSTFSATPNQSMGSGTTSQPVSVTLSGLASGTTYYFRAAASNSVGTAKGSIAIFSTMAVLPTVTTNAATAITATGATLNGGVNPNGAATTAWFEWGTSPTLSTFSVTPNQPIGSGTTVIPFSESISGIACGLFFHGIGSSSVGMQKGAIRSFSTGEDYVAIGDSITVGSHDDFPADGIGYEPILSTLLAASRGPNTIANEGVSGTSSADGAASISSILAKYPTAKYYLIMYGTNDAHIPPIPSGMGLIPTDPGYPGSFKDNMQRIISAVLAAGKIPYLAEVPYTSDPLRSNAMIYEYNAVVDELFLTNNIFVTPPPFNAYFQAHQGELDDGIHPNGTGYQSMANLWFGALTK